MKSFYILFQQELHKLVRQASTYFIAAVFLALMGFNFIYILFLNTQSNEVGNYLQNFFEIFWLPTLFIIPLISMRTLSEEQRSGILETLLATPINTGTLVLSKFLSTYIFYVFLWTCCLFFPYFTHCYLNSTFSLKLINTTTLYGGLIFILSSSFLFIAMGIFASSLTKTQALAGFLGFSFLFVLLIGIKSILEIYPIPPEYGVYIDFFETLSNLCDGLLDIRPVIFHLIGGCLFLMLTTNMIENKILQ